MTVIKNAEISVEQMYPKVERKELIGKKMGAKGVTIGEITIQPGGEIPKHFHGVEDCVLLRQGSGEIHVDGQVNKVEAPMSILIPPGAKHKVVNTGTEPIRIIYVFPSVEVDRQLVD